MLKGKWNQVVLLLCILILLVPLIVIGSEVKKGEGSEQLTNPKEVKVTGGVSVTSQVYETITDQVYGPAKGDRDVKDTKVTPVTVTNQVYQPNKNEPLKDKKMSEQEVQIHKKMEKHWDDTIRGHNINKQDWLSYELKDLDTLEKQPPTHISKPEKDKDGKLQQDDFIVSILDELEKFRKEGDSMPLVLVHSKEQQIKIVFQRDFGNGDQVVLTFKKTTGTKKLKVRDTENGPDRTIDQEGEGWSLVDTALKNPNNPSIIHQLLPEPMEPNQLKIRR